MASSIDLDSEVRVNTKTTGFQRYSEVSALDDGGWVVVWKDSPDSFTQNISMQAFNADGTRQGREVNLSGRIEELSGGSYHSVTALDDGGWAVVWSVPRDRFADVPRDLFQEIYNADGSVRADATPIVAGDFVFRSEHPSVTALEGGGLVVGWDQYDGRPGDGQEAYQIVLDENGEPIGGPERLNPSIKGSSTDVSVTALEGGGWVTTWSDDLKFNFNGNTLQQVFDEGGDKVGGIVQLNEGVAEGNEPSDTAALGGGGWVTVWVGEDADRAGVYLQAFGADGDKQGAPTRVNDVTEGRQHEAQIAVIKGGGWVVVWADNVSLDAADGFRVRQQEFDNKGREVGGEELVATSGDPFATISIDSFDDGGWIVTFNNAGDVYQRAFNIPDRTIEGDGEDNELKGKGNNDSIYGFSGDDTLSGAAGDDLLDGGKGKDELKGGEGDDVFVFAKTLGKSNVDVIVDFEPGKDTIRLDPDVFDALSKGVLGDGAFKDKADGDVDKNDRIVYDGDTGKLFYDADGKGGDKAILFAVLNNKANVSADDFVVA